MVTNMQHRLKEDEAVWNNLIKVLEKCNKIATRDKLVEQLKQEKREGSGAHNSEVPTVGAHPVKFTGSLELFK